MPCAPPPPLANPWIVPAPRRGLKDAGRAGDGHWAHRWPVVADEACASRQADYAAAEDAAAKAAAAGAAAEPAQPSDRLVARGWPHAGPRRQPQRPGAYGPPPEPVLRPASPPDLGSGRGAWPRSGLSVPPRPGPPHGSGQVQPEEPGSDLDRLGAAPHASGHPLSDPARSAVGTASMASVLASDLEPDAGPGWAAAQAPVAVAAVVAAVSVQSRMGHRGRRWAAAPVDRSRRPGHGRAERLASPAEPAGCR